MTAPITIDAIITRAIRDEEEANAFYQAVERQATNETVKRLFLQLARDEMQHKSFLEKCRSDPGLLAKLPPCVDYHIAGTVPTPTPTPSLGMKPADAIALAMKKEQQAVDLYRSLAAATQDPTLRNALEGLARMELDHKRQLEEAFVGVGYPETF